LNNSFWKAETKLVDCFVNIETCQHQHAQINWTVWSEWISEQVYNSNDVNYCNKLVLQTHTVLVIPAMQIAQMP